MAPRAAQAHGRSVQVRSVRVRSVRRPTWVAIGLVASLALGACSSDGDTDASTPTTSPATTGTGATGSTTLGTDGTTTTGTATTNTAGGGDPNGIQLVSGIRLSQGSSSAVAATPIAVVEGAPLDDAGIQAVQDRLPAWTLQDALTEPFAWPVESLPAPSAGTTVDIPFPARVDEQAPAVPTEALHVERVQPEGAVAIAPFVSITFDQPMVPVTTLAQLADADADVPASITPDIEGRWQWIGANTLRFDATSDLADRLPMATDYTVTVPAGTTSATGGVLAEDASFAFSTPAVSVQTFGPTGESLPLTPTFLATFDQRIDPQAVLDSVEVHAGDELSDVRLVSPEEIAADDALSSTVSALTEGRWIAFRPVDPFPAATDIDVRIGPGTPSAEGAAVSTEAASYGGRTYEPLAIESVECGYGPACPPGSDISILFDNPLDVGLFDPQSIVVDPPMPGAVIGAYGNTISIHGATQGRTTYTVTIPSGLTDVYGQQLGRTESRSVDIGEAAPVLQQFAQPFTTLDPLTDHPGLSVITVNHDDFRLRVFEVAPTDWTSYVEYVQSVLNMDYEDEDIPTPPWSQLDDRVVDVDEQQDRATETSVDLSGYLVGEFGHLVVLVEPTEDYDRNDDDYWNNRPTLTWAQSTEIGLDAFNDVDDLHGWATALTDGSPLPGITLSLVGTQGVATTDADGLATLPLGTTAASALLASSGEDTAILPSGYYGGGWQSGQIADEARWFVFDDRQTYKPGETVSVKGWVRRLTSASDAQLALLDDGTTVTYTVTDPQGNTIGNGASDVNPLGGFDFTFDIPAAANLGPANVQIDLVAAADIPFASTAHGFQIQEFRRPEFEVAARTESVGPYVEGEPLTLAVDADYYSGGPLGAAPVDWQVTTSAATYSPPGWDEFTFGIWTPWWYIDDGFGGGYAASDVGVYEGGCCEIDADATSELFSGETDADGSHYLQVDVGSIEDPELAGLPVGISAQATVTDVNRQALGASTSVLVHPSQLYVGLRGDDTFVELGDPLEIEAVVTDIDGANVAGHEIIVTASRETTAFENGEYVSRQVDPQTCAISTAADPVLCSFTTAVGGQYTISASVTDEQGRSSRTELSRWVSGEVTPPTRNVEQESLTVVPDREEYEPGSTARLLVQSPFPTGQGLLTVTRGSIVSTTTFDVVEGSAIIEIPVADSDIPGFDVSIEVVGAAVRAADDGAPLADAPLRPAFATGGLRLSVSTASRALAVTAVPQSEAVVPGSTTSIDVTVADASGAPVEGSDLAVVVVDEAVLALSGYELGDPLTSFYGDLASYLTTQYGRSSIVLSNPADLALGQGDATAATTAEATADTVATETTAAGTAVDDAFDADRSSAPSAAPSMNGGEAAAGTQVSVRTDFDALAVFEPSVTTDADGHATVDVPLPDNLTRYRVMVVAVAGSDRFGSAESNITARLPLMVRPSAPRFLNFGDVFELPVVVQNQTDADMTVDVVLQADNLAVTGPSGQRVTVPANERVEVRFDTAASAAGTARFRVAGVSGENADAATVELPVYTPATAEAFATYGVLDDGATLQPLVAPTDVFPQFGGLDVTTSSTSLQALTDAVLYLASYPYDSSDARASRILAISSLRDVLDAFDAPGLPNPDALDTSVSTDIDALVALQNDDGGFPYWQHGRSSDPYNTIQATHALVVAKTDGFPVPEVALQSALFYLTDIEQRIPPEYSQEARDSITAYALHVRMLAGDRDPTAAESLFASRGGELPLDAAAWLWPVVDDDATSDAIERIIENAAVDTAGAVTFTTEVGDDDYVTLRSDRRTDGLILDALIRVRPDSDLIPKVVTGLLAAQTSGRWDNVQENSFILLAMKRYFDTFESETPEFVARVWLGGRFAGEHAFSGRSIERASIVVPTAELIAAGDSGLTIANEGVGRLYYRIGLRTAPTDLDLQPLDRGFVVERTYEAVDDPGDVSQGADGTWHVRAGARVRVRLTMVAESQRTHVALIDPLPAGLEILNPALATTPDSPPDPASSGGDGVIPLDGGFPPTSSSFAWYPTWFDHQNLRDDRAEAFSTFLAAGAYDYTYVARATTPGTFVVPPVRAEEMYAPETFGRGGTDTLTVDG